MHWQTLKDYPLYEINEYGTVHNKANHFPVAVAMNKRGRLYVQLRADDGISHNEFVHRLVAKTFIPNPKHLPDVNHIDENTCNNHVDNLEWMSRKDNCNYGTRNRRIGQGRSRAVIDSAGHNYKNLLAAAEAMQVSEAAIRSAIKKGNYVTKRSKGEVKYGCQHKRTELKYKFRYAMEGEDETEQVQS